MDEVRESVAGNRRDEIKGQASSPGVAEGVARIVASEDDLVKAVPGEVLVCRYVTPGWSPAVASAAALVCDGGGLLSHAAVLARELALPAVCATGNATTLLQDGDPVRVDGSNGFVYLLPAWKAPSVPR